MKNVLLIILMLLTTKNALAEKKIISITTDVWCPYICEKESKQSGYMIDIIKKIIETKGYTLDLKIQKWSEGVSDVRAGKVTGLIGTTKDDVPDFIFPALSLGEATFHIFTHENIEWKYKNIDSLKDRKMGVIQSNIYDKTIMKFISDKNPILFITDEKDPLVYLINKLKNNEIDSIYEYPNVFRYTLKKMNEKIKFKDHGAINKFSVPVFLALSPKYENSKKLNIEIDNGLKKLRNSKKLDNILEQYFLKDWEVKKNLSND